MNSSAEACQLCFADNGQTTTLGDLRVGAAFAAPARLGIVCFADDVCCCVCLFVCRRTLPTPTGMRSWTSVLPMMCHCPLVMVSGQAASTVRQRTLLSH